MKKRIIIFVLLLGLSFTFLKTYQAAALSLGGDLVKQAAGGAGYDAENTGETTLSEIIGVVVQSVISFVGVVMVALLVYAGIMWMMARGDQDKIEKAKGIIKTTIVGLIITMAAYGITNYIVPNLIGKASGDTAPEASTEPTQ